MTTTPPADPVARSPRPGRAARASVQGGPAPLPPGGAGGKTPRPAQTLRLPQPGGAQTSQPQPDPRQAAAGMIPSPVTGPGLPLLGPDPGRGRAQAPAGASLKAHGSPPAGSTALAVMAAAMSEADLEEQIRDACTKLGILRFHVRISKGTTAGLPDDILIGPRGILWRECKNQKNKPTPAQVKTGAALTAIGQDFAIWRPEDWFSGRIRLELMAIAGLRAGAA